MLKPLSSLAVLVGLLPGCVFWASDAPPAGADDDGGPQTATFEIVFAPRVGTEEASCGAPVSALGTETGEIWVRDFRLFVHDVRLVTDDGAEVPLALDQDGVWQVDNLALLDFEDASENCRNGTPETNHVVRGAAPAGNYTGVRFSVGVPFELNHIDVAEAPPPLDEIGLFWGWAHGYSFINAVTSSRATDALDDPPTVYVFQLTSQGCEGDPVRGEVVSCTHSFRPEITLTDYSIDDHVIAVDLGALLAEVPVLSGKSCTSSLLSEDCASPFAALGIEHPSGEPTADGQRVFRVEPR